MQSSLHFTGSAFAKLSPRTFLLAGLKPTDPKESAIRANGRTPQEARLVQINTSSLSHAHGSAIVRTGNTTVICGVRGEILPVSAIPNFCRSSRSEAGISRELVDYDLLVPNIELATGSAPQFLPGVPPTTLAQTLSTRVYSLLHSSKLIDAADLRIWYTPPNLRHEDEDKVMSDVTEQGMEDEDKTSTAPELKAYWTLYIDLQFISFDGNPFDAAWTAITAALRGTKLPNAVWNADREMVVCSSADQSSMKVLPVKGLPVACTAAVFVEKMTPQGHEGLSWVLLDPDQLEESLCDESVTLVIDRSGSETRVRSLCKSGGTVLLPESLLRISSLAERRWKDVAAQLKGQPKVQKVIDTPTQATAVFSSST